MIDEKKLIDALRYDLSCFETDNLKDDELYIRVDNMIRMIEGQPKVGEWIPTSERLPEQSIEVFDGRHSSEPVIVTIKNDEGVYSSADSLLEDRWACKMQKDEVIAWQPLPEPYKEDN